MESKQKTSILELFSEEEKKRYNALRFEKDKNSFLVRRYFLRTILSEVSWYSVEEIEFGSNKYWKLFLKNNPGLLDFNVSKSNELVFVWVVKDWKIGIDIEMLKPLDSVKTLANDVFHEKEIRYLALNDYSLDIFFKLWTLKESYIKYLWVGLSKDLKSFYFEFGSDGEIELYDDEKLMDGLHICAWEKEYRGDMYYYGVFSDCEIDVTLYFTNNIILSWL